MEKFYYYSNKPTIFIKSKIPYNKESFLTLTEDSDSKSLFDDVHGDIHGKFNESITRSWKEILYSEYKNTPFDCKKIQSRGHIIYNGISYSCTGICIAAEALRDSTDSFTIHLPKNGINPLLIETSSGIGIVKGWKVNC